MLGKLARELKASEDAAELHRYFEKKVIEGAEPIPEWNHPLGHPSPLAQSSARARTAR